MWKATEIRVITATRSFGSENNHDGLLKDSPVGIVEGMLQPPMEHGAASTRYANPWLGVPIYGADDDVMGV